MHRLRLSHVTHLDLVMELRLNVAYLILFLAVWYHISCAAPVNEDKKKSVVNDVNAKEYLARFNYIGRQPNGGALEYVDRQTYKDALLKFQQMAHIPVTGKLDNATRYAMARPRCGLPDINIEDDLRWKRYAVHRSWPKKHITYKVTRYSRDMTEDEVNMMLRRAFYEWSAVTPLTFSRKESGDVDIVMYFGPADHNCSYPFEWGTLAHAFFPEIGDIHFNAMRRWTPQNGHGEMNSFLSVAIHEIGHSLGLAHSPVDASIMYPWYRGGTKLLNDDIVGIQKLYGHRPGGVKPKTYPPGEDGYYLCAVQKYDAFTRSDDDKHYAIVGSYYTELFLGGRGESKSSEVRQKWKHLSAKIDAALYMHKSYKYNSTSRRHNPVPAYTLFFKEEYVSKYVGNFSQPGFPKLITQLFRGLPSNIDSAFYVPSEEAVHFTKGSIYYRYSNPPKMDPGFPRRLASDFRGLPNSVDAAFIYYYGELLYFFKGEHCYLYDMKKNKVADGYPRPIREEWFDCKLDLSAKPNNSTIMNNPIVEPVQPKSPQKGTSGQIAFTPHFGWRVLAALVLAFCYVSSCSHQ